MYGLVNKAIEGLLRSQVGDDSWEKIKQRAEVDEEYFIGMNPYPDEISYRLVGAASEVLGVPGEQLLESFGEHWVLYVASAGYGHYLDMFGTNLQDFLMNLDNMHAQVAGSFPALKPPVFRCTEVDEHSLHLHYYSERAGLTPMVIGLLKGLGKKFETPIAIKQISNRADGADHDEFLVEF